MGHSEDLAAVAVAMWFGFAVLTWVGPSILAGMVKKELHKVSFKGEF